MKPSDPVITLPPKAPLPPAQINKISLQPSGAYSTEANTSRAPRKNTVFSLAALESLEATAGFKSGVFGLKQNSSRANSAQRAKPPKPYTHR